jgi:hypothetical protein
MRYFIYVIRLMIVAAAIATLYVGVVQGEWGETMFNATLL